MLILFTIQLCNICLLPCFRHKGKLHTLSWKWILDSYSEDYPHICAIFRLILTLPTSSASAERGFSQMTLVKTDWRSRLQSATLSDLLLIKIESADIETFNPEPAFCLWNASGERSKRPAMHDVACSPGASTEEPLGSSDEEVDLDSLASGAFRLGRLSSLWENLAKCAAD